MSSTVDYAHARRLPAHELGPALATIAEDQWFDRASIRVKPRELANVEIGFGNADGGCIVVGIHGGRVEGTDRRAEHRNELMQAHVDFTVPPVRVNPELLPCIREDGERDHLLVIEVQPGETLHTNVRDEAYLRIGDETRRLSFTQRRELLYDRGHEIFESRPARGRPSELLDDQLLQSYADALDHPEPSRLLQARGLIDQEENLTIAGLLLFGREPQGELPEALIRVLRYRGRERGAGARQQLEHDIRIEGPIPHQLVEAQRRVAELQPRRRALADTGRFEALPLVPDDAWLEGVVNAAVHRSYSLAGDHIRVEIFDDRIEIESPGRFPGLVDPSNPLDAPRFARNPRIARVCADQNFGQELGEGIRRMFEEMRLAGLGDPLYEQTQASVRLTLSGEVFDRELDARLPRGSRAVIAAIREAGALSTGEIAEHIGVSRVTAKNRLDELRSAGLVVWTGKSPRDPRASWSLPRV